MSKATPSEQVPTEQTPAVQTQSTNGGMPLNVVDVSTGQLPDLSTATPFPIDLMADYWTPAEVGEKKRLFFDRLDQRTVLDQQNGEPIDLVCAFFFERNQDGTMRNISNGSKRLVGLFESGTISRGSALEITYMGKKKTQNGRFADQWSVKPLMLNL